MAQGKAGWGSAGSIRRLGRRQIVSDGAAGPGSADATGRRYGSFPGQAETRPSGSGLQAARNVTLYRIRL
ncbi:hypothetical protein GCM10010412_051940 [Nonomuraea recticatena]|uniref:Uncharacterized protein n=1 Tax=Nonomuraea recticatena TaxID=46178 RepID=A0ABP6EPC2_9ACTN